MLANYGALRCRLFSTAVPNHTSQSSQSSSTTSKKVIEKVVGKKVYDYCGFTLPEITCRLRANGIGRVVARKSTIVPNLPITELSHAFLITDSCIDITDYHLKKGSFYGHEIFRGKIHRKVKLIPDTFRIDWTLLPKSLSDKITSNPKYTDVETTMYDDIVCRTPPLLDEFTHYI
ncbi:MAG: hypothetical protein MHMPM18_001715 [Marteilia pararefringens]